MMKLAFLILLCQSIISPLHAQYPDDFCAGDFFCCEGFTPGCDNDHSCGVQVSFRKTRTKQQVFFIQVMGGWVVGCVCVSVFY